MTMDKALYSRNDIDRLYLLRKEGVRGFARIEDCVNATTQRHGVY